MHALTHPLIHTLLKKDTEKELSWFETKVEDTVYFSKSWLISVQELSLFEPTISALLLPPIESGNGGWWIDTQGS